MRWTMEGSINTGWVRRTMLGTLGLVLVSGSIGCQVEMAGQTLPSPYYMEDDVQYFAPGPEFKLSNEAAELARQQQAAKSRPQP